ncbi:hypothetical protein SA496_04300 [Pseudomonas sp. JS3066]|uniref:hypothetical protein n=1 Tax=unclassified Pseudomonas TaxID=196821 RepID=UPI00129D6091|nr:MULTISPECIES: hypothetical protein [unclassified Pseudomonas]MDH4654013.1 hypothetical protein [Pseudomonas sp. BN606]MRK23358.1 hypothetical protein [Pseudomonas sp. JG-B]WVK94412.1 hypothetical protein SA496_04300 [Pseudomonas sp. JS3066]
MKSAICTTAFSSLLFSLVALTSFQATAEGGSDRLIQYREYQVRQQTTEDESERFAQLVEEKPTAAGSGAAREAAEPAMKSSNRYQSRIHHQRVVYE